MCKFVFIYFAQIKLSRLCLKYGVFRIFLLFFCHHQLNLPSNLSLRNTLLLMGVNSCRLRLRNPSHPSHHKYQSQSPPALAPPLQLLRPPYSQGVTRTKSFLSGLLFTKFLGAHARPVLSFKRHYVIWKPSVPKSRIY